MTKGNSEASAWPLFSAVFATALALLFAGLAGQPVLALTGVFYAIIGLRLLGTHWLQRAQARRAARSR
ncbi:MAG: hypothetical protein R3348_02840 [Xanthomonadales bacterium]|nr:hypothetical protein [Xanthomonadales bacterium]